MKKPIKILLLVTGIGVLSILLAAVLMRDSYDMHDSWSGFESMGMRGGGMMNNGRSWRWYSSFEATSENYTLESVEILMEAYLQDEYMSDTFYVAEIMLFDNQAYVQLNEKATDFGAMELLVDANTLNIYPEQGPNMMWNQKYSHMNRMMNVFRSTDWEGDPTQMTVSAEQAKEIAQEYLIRSGKSMQVEDHAEIFYGYYTLHVVNADGTIAGMLSVNGFDEDVFYHTWHGEFIEMSEAQNSSESH